MKKLFVAIVFVLCGCAKETTVNHMADNVREELTLIAEEVYALPPECGEQTKLAQRIELTRERIDIMEDAYNKEAADLRAENQRLQNISFILFVIVTMAATLLARRLLTRVSQ